MRALALLLMMSFAVAGCLEIDAVDGTLICSTVPNRACPKDYYCAPNNTCWREGHAFPDDMAIRRDMSVLPFDFSSQDLLSPND